MSWVLAANSPTLKFWVEKKWDVLIGAVYCVIGLIATAVVNLCAQSSDHSGSVATDPHERGVSTGITERLRPPLRF
jgi:hypothetical protein